jgi:hypothetical protein
VCAGVPVLHVRGHVLLLAPHAQAVPPHAPPQAGTGKITSCTVLCCTVLVSVVDPDPHYRIYLRFVEN